MYYNSAIDGWQDALDACMVRRLKGYCAFQCRCKSRIDGGGWQVADILSALRLGSPSTHHFLNFNIIIFNLFIFTIPP